MDLVIFNDAVHDEAVAALCDSDGVTAMRHIVRFAETEGVTEDGVREYVITKLADCDNILSRIARSGREIGADLYSASLADLERVFDKIINKTTLTYTPSQRFEGFSAGYINSVRQMCLSGSPRELLDALIGHYTAYGSGVLAKYTAFKYEGRLEGIDSTDSITFDELVGIDYQKKILCDNTKALLRGRRANNVLLFGDRGTGKSSSVKALLNMYADEGLRVIEMPKEYISDIPSLSAGLEKSPGKYIIFLDDLSFERHEKDYRALKIAMEGQLRANPQNVVIYATSNRRHLIKETWADRDGGEVHRNDNMQETLSLSERFGISLVFSAPSSQKEYLGIVEELLKRSGVEMTDEIGKAAVRWQMNYGGRSGRCAKQFVASYTANN